MRRRTQLSAAALALARTLLTLPALARTGPKSRQTEQASGSHAAKDLLPAAYALLSTLPALARTLLSTLLSLPALSTLLSLPALRSRLLYLLARALLYSTTNN